MTPERILELTNSPDTPHFVLGSPELDDFHKAHWTLYGGCHTDSGWYVVTHRSLNPAQRKPFRVLSYWRAGQAVPISHDVPEEL